MHLGQGSAVRRRGSPVELHSRILSGAGAGLGDLELTLTDLLHTESTRLPGVAVAGELQLPTARNGQIGTRKTDFAGYLMAGRRLGHTDVHVNFSVTWPGSPPGLQLRTVYGGAVAMVCHLTDRNDLFAEVLGNTSATQGENPEESATPEVAGGELVGTVGVSRRLLPGLQFALSANYDNNGALMFRQGFVYHLR